jgi:hypothetical protein
MAARLGCIGRFGRVSPSLVGAERDERMSKNRPQTSFKRALDDALDELDTQAENGQLSSGAYMQVAKKMKIIYDAQLGSRESGIRHAVVQMALEHANILHATPKEVDWLTNDFLEELLWTASEKHQQLQDLTENADLSMIDGWITDVISVYTMDAEDCEIFWDAFRMLTQTMARIPLSFGGRVAKCLGEFLINVAVDNTDLYWIEPFEYDDVSHDVVLEFWEEKFTLFPSDYLFEFMSRLFDDAEGDATEVEADFRKNLKKKMHRIIKRRCTCVTCSQLFPKRDAKESDAPMI